MWNFRFEIIAMDKQWAQQLGKISLTDGFSNQQLERLAKIANTITIKQNTTFIREGEPANNFFVLLKGSATVLKKSDDNLQQHKIAELTAGNTIGGMAFIEDKPRSASVQANEDLTLLTFSIHDIKEKPENYDIYTQIAINFAKTYSNRLRYTNEVTVKSMQNELDQTKVRVAIGILMVGMFYIMSLYTMSLSILSNLKEYLPNQAAISSVFIFIVCVVLFYAIKRSGYPLENYGFTTKNWRPACIEAILLSIPFMAGQLLLKWVMITYFTGFKQPLFNVTETFQSSVDFNLYFYIIAVFSYILFCPLQEFIARGALQSSLQMFVGDKSKKQVWSAIILSNLIFAAAHSHTTFALALLAFLPGLFWGWLFSRHRNLISVSISHIMIGSWAFFVVGFHGIF